jgi:DNA-directed RNA polymerase specialized sigma24 family protein/CheY-like chemotaxis protein
MVSTRAPDFSSLVAANLPYLRRYARALTGSQETGDSYAAATLEAILSDGAGTDDGANVKVALFRAFHVVWSSAGAPVGEPENALSARAQLHMSGLTPNTREALLLHAVEGFTPAEIGDIMGVEAQEAADYIDIARREMDNSVAGVVLVIEDEAIIAMDIAAIVKDIGHRVTGIARTKSEAVRLAAAQRPDLILADIQLADQSSGIDAVNEILAQFETIPVIFITAFPERLLTGNRPEPAFLITKPFTEEQLSSAVSQAMFFSSTETLAG